MSTEINVGSHNTAPTNGENGQIGTVASRCIHHLFMEGRVQTLEQDMITIKRNMWDPRLLIAIIGLFGTGLSTCGAIFGTIMAPIVSTYLKTHGLL